MSLVESVVKTLCYGLQIGLTWIATSGLGLLLGLGLIAVTFLWLYLVHRKMHRDIAREWSSGSELDPKTIRAHLKTTDFRPWVAYAQAAFIVGIVGSVHLLFDLFCLAFLSGPAQYGVQGIVLSSVFADNLLPLPYYLALPFAIVFYGYLFCSFVQANMEIHLNLHGPIAAYLLALLKMPLLPLSMLFSFLFRGVLGVLRSARSRRRRRAAKRKEKKRQKEDDPEGEEPEDLKDQIEQDGKTAIDELAEFNRLVSGGIHQQSFYWCGFEYPPQRSTNREPMVFRIFPRLKRPIRKYVVLLMLFVTLLLLISAVVPVPQTFGAFPDEKSFVAYDRSVSSLSKKFRLADVGLLTQPFRRGFDDRYVYVLKGLKLVDPESIEAHYDCDSETYSALLELREEQTNPVLRAKATLNAELCGTNRTILDQIWAQLEDFSWEALTNRQIRLRLVTEATKLLGESDDAVRSYRAGAYIMRAHREYWKAASMYESVVDNLDEEDTVLRRQSLLPVLEAARMNLQMNRFSAAVEVMEAYRKKLPDETPEEQAFVTLVDLNLALVMAQAHVAEDGRDVLLSIIENRQDPHFEHLVRRALNLSEQKFLPSVSNNWQQAGIALFGPLPAKLVAALFFMLSGLLLSLRAREAQRTAEEPQKPKKEKKVDRNVVEEYEILQALREHGAYEVSAPMPRSQGASLKAMASGPGAPLEVAPAPNRSDRLERVASDTTEDTRMLRIENVAELLPSLGRGDGLLEQKTANRKTLRSLQKASYFNFLMSWLNKYGHKSHGTEFEIYAHQQRTMDLVIEGLESQQGSTIVLSSGGSSGRTTIAFAAAVETILQYGKTVLFVCATPFEAAKQGVFFDDIRAREDWAWSLMSAVGTGGVDRSLEDDRPIQLLIGDPELLHRRVLPPEQQHLLHSFLRNLGLVVVEDVHLFNGPQLAHASFLFRRFSELLAGLDNHPTCLTTVMPIMKDEENLVRELLGPLAVHLRYIPDSADDAPCPQEHVSYVLHRGRYDEAPEPEVSEEYTAASIIQAAGVPTLPDDPGVLDSDTSWPTAFVGFPSGVLPMEDRAIRFYHKLQVRRLLPLSEPEYSRATVFPLTPGSLSWFDADTRHVGIAPEGGDGDWGNAGEEDESTAGEEELKEERRRRHSTFLLCGPEPVDRYLADLFSCRVGQDEDEGTYALEQEALILEMTQKFKPEWVIPRRNRPMNTYHFGCAMEERPAPGQRLRFLEDMFEGDLLEEMLSRLKRYGQLHETTLPYLERVRSLLQNQEFVWAPRRAGASDAIAINRYDHQLVRIVDRVTHQEMTRVEKCRCKGVFYPGRVFSAGGVRMKILAPRYQTALKRDEWFCEPMPLPRWTSPLRSVAIRPLELDRGAVNGQLHTLDRGRPFGIAFCELEYREDVEAAQVFHKSQSQATSVERFEPQRMSFSTEGLVLTFDERVLGDWAEAEEIVRPILLGTALLLRQVLPMVLHVDREDLHICYGVGDNGTDEGWIAATDSFPMRLERGVDRGADEENGDFGAAYIAIVDRMEGSLGYARLLHERLLQGDFMREWLEQALRLCNWAFDAQEDPFEAFRTRCKMEDVDAERLFPTETREFILRLLGKESFEPDLELWQFKREKGLKARKGVQDPMGFSDAESIIGQWLLPNFHESGDTPWYLTLHCALLAFAPDSDERLAMEKLIMACIVLARRGMATGSERQSLPSPLGADRLQFYTPEGPPYLLEAIPPLTDTGRLVLEEVYGRTGTALGLVHSEMLTQRGCFLARSVLGRPSIRQAFDTLREAVQSGQLNVDPSQVVADLEAGDMSFASRRILLDGMHEIAQEGSLPRLWQLTLRGGKQSQRLDSQMKTAEGRCREFSEPIQGKVRTAAAMHRLDRACKTAIAAIRVELSRGGSAPIEVVLEETSKSSPELWSNVLQAATEVQAAPGFGKLPEETTLFISTLAGMPAQGASILKHVVRRMEDSLADDAPFTLSGNRLVRNEQGQKKIARDDSRGMLFRLNALGEFLAETRWQPDAPALALETSPAPDCTGKEPVPSEWNVPFGERSQTPSPPPEEPPMPEPALEGSSGEREGRRHEWQDFTGKKWSLSFQIPDEVVRRSQERFGYTAEELRLHQLDALRRISDEISVDYPGCTVTPGESASDGEGISYQMSGPSPFPHEIIGARVSKRLEEEKLRFYHDHGFRLEDGSLYPDHPKLVKQGMLDVAEVAAQLGELGRSFRHDPKRWLGFLVSFVQALEYRIPPGVRPEDGRITTELLIPAETLSYGWGDCDSRSVLFAALWKSLNMSPVGVVHEHKHMMAAVGGQYSSCGIWTIDDKGQQFLICELAVQNGYIPPGTNVESGPRNLRFELV